MQIDYIQRLHDYNIKLKDMHGHFLGYPQNQAFQYDELDTFDFLNSCINNVGDPFAPSNYRINSKQFEREVIEYFAGLYKIADEEKWGYVTSGGTEGNMYGIYLGREKYPNSILYYTRDSHYSISKASRMFRIEGRIVDTGETGEMDYLDFYSKLDPTRPSLVVANIGSTVKGAIDDLGKIRDILRQKKVKQSYIHCDAALAGMLLPFLPNAPEVDFRHGIDSLSISGHKFIGCPFPCGVVIAKKMDVKALETHIDYVGTQDNTILGSRSGLSVLYLWYAIQKWGSEGFAKQARQCIENANYFYESLKKIGTQAWLHNFSNTVYFERPDERIMQKWQLAGSGDIAHVITMQHATHTKLDLLLDDLKPYAMNSSQKTSDYRYASESEHF